MFPCFIFTICNLASEYEIFAYIYVTRFTSFIWYSCFTLFIRFLMIISNLHQPVLLDYSDYSDYRFALFFWFAKLTILPGFWGLLRLFGFLGFSVILVY